MRARSRRAVEALGCAREGPALRDGARPREAGVPRERGVEAEIRERGVGETEDCARRARVVFALAIFSTLRLLDVVSRPAVFCARPGGALASASFSGVL